MIKVVAGGGGTNTIAPGSVFTNNSDSDED
jgi:hypothetical protein